MISQSLFRTLRMCADVVRPGDSAIKYELQQFITPYVLIIHKPSGRGFYLNRDYRHIIDVANCREPSVPVEVSRQHLCACSNIPCWVMAEKMEEFDTFWLY